MKGMDLNYTSSLEFMEFLGNIPGGSELEDQ